MTTTDIGLPKTPGRLLEELLLKHGDMALRSKVARNVFALGDKLRKLEDIKDAHFRVELISIVRDMSIARARAATAGLESGPGNEASIQTLFENVLRTMAKEAVRAAGGCGKRALDPRYD
jgi:hypothetical protein